MGALVTTAVVAFFALLAIVRISRGSRWGGAIWGGALVTVALVAMLVTPALDGLFTQAAVPTRETVQRAYEVPEAIPARCELAALGLCSSDEECIVATCLDGECRCNEVGVVISRRDVVEPSCWVYEGHRSPGCRPATCKCETRVGSHEPRCIAGRCRDARTKVLGGP